MWNRPANEPCSTKTSIGFAARISSRSTSPSNLRPLIAVIFIFGTRPAADAGEPATTSAIVPSFFTHTPTEKLASTCLLLRCGEAARVALLVPRRGGCALPWRGVVMDEGPPARPGRAEGRARGDAVDALVE